MVNRARYENRDILTERELGILQLAADGLSNEEIASNLFLEGQTIKFHKTNLYKKLNVNNITAAVVKGIQIGIIECPCRNKDTIHEVVINGKIYTRVEE